MKSATIIDLSAYLNQQKLPSESPHDTKPSCSEELGIAIQTLIQQMRRSNSLKYTG